MYPVLDDDFIGTVSSIIVEDKHDWHMVDNVGCSAPSSWRSSLTASSISCNFLVDTV